MSANNPDIVIKDNANQCCKLTDVSVPSNQNTSTKVIEKLSKYKDLETESMRMWGMRTLRLCRFLLVPSNFLEREWTRI